MILILTDLDNDAHAEYVSQELSRRGEDALIYNPGSYPLSSTITTESTNGQITSILSWDNFEVDLSKVKSIWYRRPGSFNISSTLKKEESEWLRQECTHLFDGLWTNLQNAFWVSQPANIRRASLKLFQLGIAGQLGFRVPRFVITNDIEQAQIFIQSHKDVVVKVLSRPAIFGRKKVAEIYTHLLTKEDTKQLFSVRFGPTFLQEFIPKKRDVRVTVIGDSVFAAAIDSTGFKEARIDFRKSQIYKLPHEIIDLPSEIKTKCVNLVQKMGLQFGAIDLLLTSDGRYVFLEINPNGQWLWIEEITGMHLTNKMCDLLSFH